MPRTGGFLTRTIDPAELPTWLSEADIDFYAGEFARTGFRGGLNWIQHRPQLGSRGALRRTAGDGSGALRRGRSRSRGFVRRHGTKCIPNLAKFVPDLRGATMLPGCGHWTQQERANEVNSAILGFLGGLP